MALFPFLNRPHPLQINTSSIVMPCVVVFLLFVLLTPFGFMRSSMAWRMGFAFLFTLIAGASSLGVLATWSRLGKLESDRWTVGKECLLHVHIVTIIALLNSLLVWVVLIQWLEFSTWSLGRVLWNIGLGTYSISVVPIVSLVTYEHLQQQRHQYQTALALNEELSQALERAQTPPSSEPVQLYSEQGKPVLQILPTELLFVRSDGNYVEVFYRAGGGDVQHLLVRNRLKTILSQLPETLFFNCHKRYIINLKQIVRVEGNARNIAVFLRNYTEPIPISRSKTQALKSRMQQR